MNENVPVSLHRWNQQHKSIFIISLSEVKRVFRLLAINVYTSAQAALKRNDVVKQGMIMRIVAIK